MYASNSEYDRGVNTFSPEGRLFQVEYATESIKLGTTSIGIWTQEGVVLAAENRIISPLMVADSISKIYEIDGHAGVALSGLIGDGKLIVSHARQTAQTHRFKYNEPMPPKTLTQAISDLALRFGESGSSDSEDRPIMSRPFGVALLVGGVHAGQPQLFYTEPSGTFLHYTYKAVGAGAEVATALLQKEYQPTMALRQATVLAATVLKKVMEDTATPENIQMAVADPEHGFRPLCTDELQTVLSAAH